MPKSLKLFSLILFLFIFSCNDTGPTIDNTNNSGNHAPEIPKNPFPHNDTTGVPRLVTVSWTCEDPDAGDSVKFNIYIDNNNPPSILLVENLAANSYFVPYLLDTNTLYYWRVVAKDNHGAVTNGPNWKFRTGLTD